MLSNVKMYVKTVCKGQGNGLLCVLVYTLSSVPYIKTEVAAYVVAYTMVLPSLLGSCLSVHLLYSSRKTSPWQLFMPVRVAAQSCTACYLLFGLPIIY